MEINLPKARPDAYLCPKCHKGAIVKRITASGAQQWRCRACKTAFGPPWLPEQAPVVLVGPEPWPSLLARSYATLKRFDIWLVLLLSALHRVVLAMLYPP